MGRNKYLEPKARQVIDNILDSRGEITMETALEIISPHLTFDMNDLKEQKAKQIVRSIMQSRRDLSGVRTCFATKRQAESVYIDIDTCKNVEDMRIVEQQLNEKKIGIVKSHKKAEANLKILEGQMMMEGLFQNRG